jgi:hypothetical protein
VAEPAPRQSWTAPALIIGAIALIAIVGVLVALDQVESDAEREAAKPAIVVERPQPPGSQEKPTDVAAWPEGTAAYTVSLARMDDESLARARATAAVGAGIPAGVLDSDAYPTLEPGAWVLFAGRFDTETEAAREAARYAAAGFPEAQVAFVSDGSEPQG